MKIRDYLSIVCAGVVLTGALMIIGVATGGGAAMQDEMIWTGLALLVTGGLGFMVVTRERD